MNREQIISDIVSLYKSCPYPAPAVYRRGKPHTTVDFSKIGEEVKAARDEYYMKCALELAEASLEFGEVPVGAVMVRGDEIVAADFNGRESEKNALYHAETAVIEKTCRAMGGWRLPGCELFVTLEPCIMCAGAIFQARVPRLVFGAADPKAGFFGGIANACEMPLNHKISVKSGVLAENAKGLLEDFFAKKR